MRKSLWNLLLFISPTCQIKGNSRKINKECRQLKKPMLVEPGMFPLFPRTSTNAEKVSAAIKQVTSFLIAILRTSQDLP
jgi:hypothetical protein